MVGDISKERAYIEGQDNFATFEVSHETCHLGHWKVVIVVLVQNKNSPLTEPSLLDLVPDAWQFGEKVCTTDRGTLLILHVNRFIVSAPVEPVV